MAHRWQERRMTLPTVLALCVVTLFVWSDGSAAQEETRANADLHGFQRLQTRIATLNVNGVALTNYHLAKAQAWLDFSKEEYFDNDRSGIVESTFNEAYGLIEQLEAGVTTTLSMTTPLLEGDGRLDSDSWQAVEEMKVQKLVCAGNLIARLEVQLVHVEHEFHELGQIHAAPYRQAVQRMLDELRTVDCGSPSPKKTVVPTEAISETKP